MVGIKQGDALQMSKDLRTQSEQLAELESVIKVSFVSAGNAFAQIRDRGLYRSAEYPTFEAYCKGRWSITDERVRQLAGAAETVRVITGVSLDTTAGPVPAPAPASERVIRPIVSKPAEVQRAAWKSANERAAVEQKPVTARHVQTAVDEILPQPKVPTRPGATGKRAGGGVSTFDPGTDADPDEATPVDFDEWSAVRDLVEGWVCAQAVGGGGRQKARAAEYLRTLAQWIERS
jgi:hypothetical protein